MSFIKNNIVALVAIVIAIVACFLPVMPGHKSLLGDISTCNGSTSCFTSLYASTNFQLSSSGTTQSNQVVTSCSMKANNSITATTTGYEYCTGATGVTSSDFVFAQFATSTKSGTFAAIKTGFSIVSAKASTTAGTIDFIVMNLSGKTQSPAAASKIGSTTQIFAVH